VKRFLFVAPFILALALARPARAYTVSCSDFVSLATSTDPQANGEAAGYVAGAIDFLAGLLCFVGSPQCQCVQNLVVTQANALSSAIVTHVDQCIAVDGTQAAFGSISRGAHDLCPF